MSGIENVEFHPADNFEKRPLGPGTRLCLLGAGPTTISTALELAKSMGADVPQLTIIEQKNYHLEEGGENWENCKGCASRVPLQTLRSLHDRYDSGGEVFTFEGDTVVVNDGGKKKFLAQNILDEIEFHMPSPLGDKLSAVGRLSEKEQMAMTYRHMGPRVIYNNAVKSGLESNGIGLHKTLLLLLENQLAKHGQKPIYIQGKVREVDLSNDKPAVLIDQKGGSQKVETDLVISGLGTAPVVAVRTKSGVAEQRRTKRIGTAIREIEINSEKAGKIYGSRLNKAQLFVLPHRGEGVGRNIQYAMLLPQWMSQNGSEKKAVVTVALVERNDGQVRRGQMISEETEKIINHLSDYLPEAKTLGNSSCQCMPFIPVESLPVAQMWDENYLVVGDQAGSLRYLKNGIGTGNETGVKAAELLLKWGYSPSALGTIATELNGMYYRDNNYGRELLKWLDELVSSDSKMSALASGLLYLEQFFPSEYQVVLEALKGIGTGIFSYEEIIARLFDTEGKNTIYKRGMGKAVEIMAQLSGHPVLKDFSWASGSREIRP